MVILCILSSTTWTVERQGLCVYDGGGVGCRGSGGGNYPLIYIDMQY